MCSRRIVGCLIGLVALPFVTALVLIGLKNFEPMVNIIIWAIVAITIVGSIALLLKGLLRP